MKQPVQIICLSLLPICIQCSWWWWFWKWCWWKWKDDDYHVGIIYIVKKGSQQTMKVTTITAIVLAACNKNCYNICFVVLFFSFSSSCFSAFSFHSFCFQTPIWPLPRRLIKIPSAPLTCFCSQKPGWDPPEREKYLQRPLKNEKYFKKDYGSDIGV